MISRPLAWEENPEDREHVPVLSPITYEGTAVWPCPTVSQFAKPVKHHPEVRISLVLRALEAQDTVRRGYIHGNAAANGLRSSGAVCSAGLPGEVPIQ